MEINIKSQEPLHNRQLKDKINKIKEVPSQEIQLQISQAKWLERHRAYFQLLHQRFRLTNLPTMIQGYSSNLFKKSTLTIRGVAIQGRLKG